MKLPGPFAVAVLLRSRRLLRRPLVRLAARYLGTGGIAGRAIVAAVFGGLAVVRAARRWRRASRRRLRRMRSRRSPFRSR